MGALNHPMESLDLSDFPFSKDKELLLITEKDWSKTNIKNINQIIEPHFFLWADCAPLRSNWGQHNGETKWPVSFPDGHAIIMSDSRAHVTLMYGGGVENDWFGVKQHEGWHKDKLGI